jgi:hypothetical protein
MYRLYLIIRRALELWRDKYHLPWYTRIQGYPGTVIGHQSYFRLVQRRIGNVLDQWDGQGCGGWGGRIVSWALRAVTRLPAPAPLFRRKPAYPNNWASYPALAPTAPTVSTQQVMQVGGAAAVVTTVLVGIWWLGKLASPLCGPGVLVCAAVL